MVENVQIDRKALKNITSENQGEGRDPHGGGG